MEPIRNKISRFTATNDVATPGSETLILNLEVLGAALIHNGGALHFGPDGKLYVAIGENANTQAAQNLDSYFGKLLRINKDGSVPTGNPFTTGSEQRRRVWAYGLRNPFTFSIDHETSRIFVNDVGQGLWEEINDATVGGRNFGWPATEGKFTQSQFPLLTNPVYAYAHGTGADGIGCAIVGGTFISASNPNYPPQYRGKYLFQDNCGNWINMLDLSGATAVRSPFATSIIQNSLGLTMGRDGFLYVCARHGESLYRIVYNNALAPTITNHPANKTVLTGQPASFTVTALGALPFSYQWQKGTTNITGATSATYTIPQTVTGDAGQYRVIVSNGSGSATSNAATLAVVNNSLPTANIITPTAPSTYVAGMTINFSGSGTDPEDGNLTAQTMSWGINFHHDTHHHDQPPINGISSGSFMVPQEGETSDNVWYRIILTVTDSHGFKAKDSVDVFPMKSVLNFATSPAGLQITLDGQPFNTPGSVVSVEGTLRTLGVTSPQTLNNESYEFTSWSQGGSQSQSIVTPVEDATYTANFTKSQNTFYRAINFNGPALVIDGNNWQASTGAPNFSFTGAVYANQGGPLTPATDANRASMLRSIIWSNPTVAVSAVPAGGYLVYVYVWEDNSPITYSLSLEGAVVQPNYNSGAGGTWRKLGPFPVTINDGTINLSANHMEANLSGIEIWRVGQPPVGSPTIPNPIADQTATADTPFSYAFPLNTFSPGQPGGTLTYSATLSTGNPLPSWLTFTPANRTFSGTPTNANVGPIDIRVTATEGAASVNDIFRLTVNGTSTSTFYRAINLNGPALVIDGNNWQASTGAPNFSFIGAVYANQSGPLIPATDANRATMLRSIFWYNPNVTISAVPAGSYQVYVYVWEDNFPITYSLSVEGAIVQPNYNSGPGGTWRKLGPFPVNVNDGTITVSANHIEANLSGIEIWSTTQGSQSSSSLRIATENSEEVQEDAKMELSFYPNPLSNKATIAFSALHTAPTSVSMYDVRGVKVKSLFDRNVESGFKGEIELEASNLNNGIYILEMINGQSTKRLKMMVAK